MEEDKNFAYQLLQHKDLSNRDLKDADFSNAVLDDVDLTDSDLRGSCFVGADLRKVHITMDCRTLEDVLYDDGQIKLILALLLKAKIKNDVLAEEVVQKLREYISDNTILTISGLLTNIFTKKELYNINVYFKSINR